VSWPKLKRPYLGDFLEEGSNQSFSVCQGCKLTISYKGKTYSGYFAKLVGFGVEVYSWALPWLHSGGRRIYIASTATPYDPYFKFDVPLEVADEPSSPCYNSEHLCSGMESMTRM